MRPGIDAMRPGIRTPRLACGFGAAKAAPKPQAPAGTNSRSLLLYGGDASSHPASPGPA